MRRTIIPAIAVMILGICCKTYEVPNLIKDPPKPVQDYPAWSIPQIELVHSASPGTSYKWFMAYKNGPYKDKYPDSALFAVPVTKGHAIEIQVNSHRGNPAILIWDRILHKNDAYARIQGYDTETSYPGNPLAFEVGKNGQLSFCFSPKHNGVLKAWLWILNGDYISPGPFESEDYDDPAYDSIMGDMSGSQKVQLKLMDSLFHVDELQKAWSNRVTNTRDFTRAKVDISIKEGNCPSLPYFDYYQGMLTGIDTLGTFITGGVTPIAELQAWYYLLERLDSLRSISFRNNRQLHQDGIVLKNELVDISLESRWLSWTGHPVIQGILLRRDAIYQSFPGEEEAGDLFKMRLVSERGESGILEDNISKILAQANSKLNGISSAIYDRQGYVVAATQPFTFMNIFDTPNWDKIQNIQETFSTDCYERTGYGFEVKKVFIPIKAHEDSRQIGWLMAEVYCK